MRVVRTPRWRLVAVLVALPLALELTLRLVLPAVGRGRGIEFHAEYGWRPVPDRKSVV